MTTLDLAGTFGLRVGGVDVREFRVGGHVAGRWERQVNRAPVPRLTTGGYVGAGAGTIARIPGGGIILTRTSEGDFGIDGLSGLTGIAAAPGQKVTVAIDYEPGNPLGYWASGWVSLPAGHAVSHTVGNRWCVTFTIPEGRTGVIVRPYVRLPNVTATFDHLDIYDGDFDPNRTYFDGDTPDTPAALHHWTATPHASTSVRTLAWQPGD